MSNKGRRFARRLAERRKKEIERTDAAAIMGQTRADRIQAMLDSRKAARQVDPEDPEHCTGTEVFEGFCTRCGAPV